MSKHHPFRFGLCTSAATSRKALIETALRAEAIGYDSLLVIDHLDTALAPIAALATAANATSTLRVGSIVFGNDFRHPVYLAKEAATIDLLSDGRLELGLGTGWMRKDYEMSGIPLERPGIRISRLQEAVQVIKGFFADSPFTFTGKYYSVHNLEGKPESTQKPHPPLMLGGGGQRMLSFAAREADIVSFGTKTTVDGRVDFGDITADAAAQKVEWVRQAAGERFNDLTLNTFIPGIAITDKRRQAAEELRRRWNIPDDDLSVDQLLECPTVLLGTVDQIVEDLQMRRKRYGLSYHVVGEMEEMEQFAPVVERLAGT